MKRFIEACQKWDVGGWRNRSMLWPLYAIFMLMVLLPPAEAQAHSVSLTCTASTTGTVTGYFFYRSTTSGSGYTKLNATPVSSCAYTDTTVQANTTYFYVATAFDPGAAGGNQESSFSNQVTAVIPPNPQPNPPTSLTLGTVALLRNSDGTVTITAQYQDKPGNLTRFQVAQVYPYKVVKSGSLSNASGQYTVSWVGPMSGQGFFGVCDSTGKCVSAYAK